MSLMKPAFASSLRRAQGAWSGARLCTAIVSQLANL
jgi:hypothetical protein